MSTSFEDQEDDFCRDKLVLKAEEASFIDLLRILSSSCELRNRKFIEGDSNYVINNQLQGFGQRWLLFISLVAQKLLFYLRKPLAWIGFFFEMFLNLLSNNGGFHSLWKNVLKGNVVWPDKRSATFRSVVGYTDLRVDLDKNITYGDSNYNASLSIMASKLSYENEAFVKTVVTDSWKMVFLGFFNFLNDYQDQLSTQAIMFNNNQSADPNGPNLIVVAFRGTEPFDADAWGTDVDISWFELEGVGKIHGGFMKALGLQKGKGWPKDLEKGRDQSQYAYYAIRQKLRDMLNENKNSKFIVTGHSLGGALAILFAAVLGLHEEAWLLERLEGVYTFGQPRVGDGKFGDFMKEKFKVHNVRYYRFVYCNDIVPRLPYDDGTFFKHFGTCLYYNSFYKGKIVVEEPNKNYFSLLWAIPKDMNAAWELIRSFIIPRIKGPDYNESWFLRFCRVIGLVIPGLPAHVPQDYVNATRLGSLSDFLQGAPVHHQGPKHD